MWWILKLRLSLCELRFLVTWFLWVEIIFIVWIYFASAIKKIPQVWSWFFPPMYFFVRLTVNPNTHRVETCEKDFGTCPRTAFLMALVDTGVRPVSGFRISRCFALRERPPRWPHVLVFMASHRHIGFLLAASKPKYCHPSLRLVSFHMELIYINLSVEVVFASE